MAKSNNTIPYFTQRQADRFWKKVRKLSGDECWPWCATTGTRGYGTVIRQKDNNRIKLLAHRVAYFLHHGKDPGSLCVCHTCDNTACCNPRHLFLGTHADNNHDRDKKGHTAIGDRSGPRTHPEKLRRGDAHPTHLYPEIVRRGESHGSSKLTDKIVQEIRQRANKGHGAKSRLAREFGVSASLVSAIVLRKVWKHV